MIEKFAQAATLINQARHILLATHEEPDTDALGAMLGLHLGLTKLGKNALAFCASSIPPTLKFLPGIEKIQTDLDLNCRPELIVGLDYGSIRRLRLEKKYLEPTLNFITFDHHLIGDHLGLVIADPAASSTSEIIYRFLEFLDVALDRQIATCLLAGIFDDTYGFWYPCATEQTLSIAAALLNKGAPLQKIAGFLAQTNLPSEFKLWAQVISNADFDSKSGLISAFVNYQKFLEFNSEPKSSTLANLLSAASEVKVALLLTEKSPGKIEGSLRSQKDRGVNVAQIAQAFGGGGHALAAGFQTSATPQDIINQVKKLI